MTKNEIRKLFLQKRLALSDIEFKKLNDKVTANFFLWNGLSQIEILHSFLPIEKQREVNTWQILERVKKDFPAIKISVPKINNQTSLMDNFYFEGPEQLEKNTFGIPEPKQGIPTPTEKIDAVLVPLLACDKFGNRVGYGRGFYDKFLSSCRADCKKIGLSFYDPLQKQIEDVHAYDIPLDTVVTPVGVFNLKRA
jgi:5-formyltetrahydrofolate cyclo-ligase